MVNIINSFCLIKDVDTSIDMLYSPVDLLVDDICIYINRKIIK